MLYIAWRCLYAEVVHSRVEGTRMDVGRALHRVWQMTITRLRAEGEKWRRWHVINVGSGRKSYFPKKYQDRKVITFDEYANYKINSLILGAYEITKPKPTNSPIPTATPDTPGQAPPSTGRQRQKRSVDSAVRGDPKRARH
jgi:hypothetical protein